MRKYNNKAELKIIQTLFLSSGLLSMLTEGFSILYPGSLFGLKENLIPATFIEERKVITHAIKRISNIKKQTSGLLLCYNATWTHV